MMQERSPIRREVIAPASGACVPILALLAAAGSLVVTLAILDPAGIGDRIADLTGEGGAVRTVEMAGPDPAAAIAKLAAERDALRRRLDAANDDIVTGSIGAVAAGGLRQGAVGADLGPAASVSVLRAAWAGIRARLGDDAKALQPLIAIRETRHGDELHMVIGPTADIASAASLCAKLGALASGCTAAAFDGQRLPSP